jgi:hypothetical protein
VVYKTKNKNKTNLLIMSTPPKNALTEEIAISSPTETNTETNTEKQDAKDYQVETEEKIDSYTALELEKIDTEVKIDSVTNPSKLSADMTIVNSYAFWSETHSFLTVICGVFVLMFAILAIFNNLYIANNYSVEFLLASVVNLFFGVITGIVAISMGINMKKSSHFAKLSTQAEPEQEIEKHLLVSFKYLRNYSRVNVIAIAATFVIMMFFLIFFSMVLVNIPGYLQPKTNTIKTTQTINQSNYIPVKTAQPVDNLNLEEGFEFVLDK